MANTDLHFFFLQDPATDSSGTAAAAAKFVNALPITSVKDLVYQILARIRQTNGRIKTLTIMAHGLDDPSGPDDPHMFISIGRDDITLERALKDPLLPLLAPYFQSDALVRLYGCNISTSRKLLQAFSRIWGGVQGGSLHGEHSRLRFAIVLYYDYCRLSSRHNL
jgi:hypothetical protein